MYSQLRQEYLPLHYYGRPGMFEFTIYVYEATRIHDTNMFNNLRGSIQIVSHVQLWKDCPQLSKNFDKPFQRSHTDDTPLVDQLLTVWICQHLSLCLCRFCQYFYGFGQAVQDAAILRVRVMWRGA